MTIFSLFQPLATALFSFLYHLASYEAGGEALVSCGMMESLLKVINHLPMIILIMIWIYSVFTPSLPGDPVAEL